MIRRTGLFISVLFMIFLILFVFLPIIPPPPKLVLSTTQPNQEVRFLHLELATIYERGGILDKAQDEYELAVNEQQDDITISAKNGLDRVVSYQNDKTITLLLDIRSFLMFIIEICLKILIIASFVWFIWELFKLVPKRAGYRLSPINDHTGANLDIPLTNLIYSTIQSAKSIHLEKKLNRFITSENLSILNLMPLENISNDIVESLQIFDNFKVGDIDFPFGKLALLFQRWRSTAKYELRGNAYKLENHVWIEIERWNTAIGLVEHRWEEHRIVSNEKDVSDNILILGKNIAYQIFFDFVSKPQAVSWKSLKLFTESLRGLKGYRNGESKLLDLEHVATNLEEAMSIDPNYHLAKFNLGIVYNILGQYSKAVSIFKECKENNSQFKLEAIYNLGTAYYHYFQDWAYSQAINQFNELIELLDNLQGSENKMILLSLAECGLANVYAQQVGREEKVANEFFEKVREHCEHALSLVANDPEIYATVHFALGVAHYNKKDYDRAISELSSAVKIKPDYPITYVYLSDCDFQKENKANAINWLQMAIQINPRYEYAYYKLGEIYRLQREPDLALKAYENAPHNADANNSLGELLAENGQYDEALSAFRRAIKINSKLANAYSNFAWFSVEANKGNENLFQEAVIFARKALQLNEGTRFEWHGHDILGWIYYNSKRYMEAEKEFQISITHDNSKVQNRYHLALLYTTLEQYAKAYQVLVDLFTITTQKGIWRDKAVELMELLKNKNDPTIKLQLEI